MTGNQYNEACAERVGHPYAHTLLPAFHSLLVWWWCSATCMCKACCFTLGAPLSPFGCTPCVMLPVIRVLTCIRSGLQHLAQMKLTLCNLQQSSIMSIQCVCSRHIPYCQLTCPACSSQVFSELNGCSWSSLSALPSHTFTELNVFACSLQVFSELNGDSWSSLSALRSCIGDIQEDRDNSIMEAEMASQRGDADTGEVRFCVVYRYIQILYIRIKMN